MVNKTILTPKQEAFCLEYVKLGGNGVKAALAAGYDVEQTHTAEVIASENIRKPEIIQRIDELRAEIAKRSAIMPVAERQERLSEIARADLADFIDESKEPELKKSAAISEYETVTYINKKGIPVTKCKLKLHSSITAIAELNKMDHVYETGTHIVPVQVLVQWDGNKHATQQS